MSRYRPSDIAFSDAVKAVQAAKGSRSSQERMTAARPWSSRLTPYIAAFVETRTSAFLGTASLAGQPYIQHRGGPAGFLRVLDETTIGFADLAGNRQYITLGNLSENPRAHLFLIDYTHRQRVKFWGEARVIENDPELVRRLRPPSGKGRAERAILFTVRAWDVNCPQHIPVRYDADAVAELIAERDARIARLESELLQLRGG